MQDKKHMGTGEWDIKQSKVAPFYTEPKPGCPKFIMKDSKCNPKGIPEWGLK